jgi:uncharacterized repeat protein (TIGR03803 family)
MKKIITIIVILTMLGLSNTYAQYTKLLDFTGSNGGTPYGSFILNNDYLYGMTSGWSVNSGNIFKIKTDGTGYDDLLDFTDCPDGAGPYNSLIFIGDTLYGMTTAGGNPNMYGGIIFKIRPDGSGYTNILTLDSTTGYNPYSSLFYDGTYLYGTTVGGGTLNYGTIFKIKPDGSGFDTIYNFAGSTDANVAYGSLISDGTFLYGMSYMGGTTGNGTIYKIKPDGTGYTKIKIFGGQPDGSNPWGDLIYDGTYLYGMTAFGGTNNWGTIFKIKPDGSGFTKLLDFNGTANGRYPFGGLYSDGTYLYGMTNMGGTSTNCTDGCGVIFKIKPDGSSYAKLYDFDSTDGSAPFASLISDGNNLYGMTNTGGTTGNGVVFKLSGVITDISDINENNNVAVFPNPACNNITITIEQKSTIEISNIQGQIVLQQQLQQGETNINICGLVKGVYFLHLNNDKTNKVIKIIKE